MQRGSFDRGKDAEVREWTHSGSPAIGCVDVVASESEDASGASASGGEAFDLDGPDFPRGHWAYSRVGTGVDSRPLGADGCHRSCRLGRCRAARGDGVGELVHSEVKLASARVALGGRREMFDGEQKWHLVRKLRT